MDDASRLDRFTAEYGSLSHDLRVFLRTDVTTGALERINRFRSRILQFIAAVEQVCFLERSDSI